MSQEVMDIGYEADPKYDSGFRYCGTSCYDTGKRSNYKRGAYIYDFCIGWVRP